MIFKGDLQVKKSEIGQFEDGLGVFALKPFIKGEIVIKWNLKILNKEKFNNLSDYEKNNFCHRRKGILYFYEDPERHVNRSKHPNVIPDFDKEANIALCDIEIGDELSIPISFMEDFD